MFEHADACGLQAFLVDWKPLHTAAHRSVGYLMSLAYIIMNRLFMRFVSSLMENGAAHGPHGESVHVPILH